MVFFLDVLQHITWKKIENSELNLGWNDEFFYGFEFFFEILKNERNVTNFDTQGV